MTIKEMEAQIDRLGLEKLEVRLSKGREVDVFICAIKNNECAELEEDDQRRGEAHDDSGGDFRPFGY